MVFLKLTKHFGCKIAAITHIWCLSLYLLSLCAVIFRIPRHSYSANDQRDSWIKERVHVLLAYPQYRAKLGKYRTKSAFYIYTPVLFCAALCCVTMYCDGLYCTVLCCSMCCAALVCAIMRYGVLYCTVLCCAVLCCAMLCCAKQCGAVRCGVMWCAARCRACLAVLSCASAPYPSWSCSIWVLGCTPRARWPSVCASTGTRRRSRPTAGSTAGSSAAPLPPRDTSARCSCARRPPQTRRSRRLAQGTRSSTWRSRRGYSGALWK